MWVRVCACEHSRERASVPVQPERLKQRDDMKSYLGRNEAA